MNKQSAVEYCEEKYPQTTQEFKDILDEMYETFCKKQRNYGPGNISVGSPLETTEDKNVALTGLWFRVNDKVQRIKNLLMGNRESAVDEPLEDAFLDMSNYGIMATIVKNRKWGK